MGSCPDTDIDPERSTITSLTENRYESNGTKPLPGCHGTRVLLTARIS